MEEISAHDDQKTTLSQQLKGQNLNQFPVHDTINRKKKKRIKMENKKLKEKSNSISCLMLRGGGVVTFLKIIKMRSKMLEFFCYL